MFCAGALVQSEVWRETDDDARVKAVDTGTLADPKNIFINLFIFIH